MAVLAAAQLLDELMGRNRNTNPNEVGQKLNWEDPQYCKYYMVKFCPHDLFVNTRADLGACPHIHDDEVKELFEKAEPNHKKQFYQDEFLRFCQSMINDVERKIQKGKQRLELMNTKIEIPAMSAAQSERNQEEIKALSDRIATLEAEAEQAGIRGDVDQAQSLMKHCDQLKEQKEQLLKQSENTHWSLTAELAAAQEKQMEVCAVCGAFLIVGDAQQRIDDHLMGKQHVGYFRLKEAFDEISKEREKQKQEREKRHDHDRDRRGGLGSDRDRERTRDRDRERDRDRRSHRSDRDKERERDRDKDSLRDRDRDRMERHRSNRDDRGSRHRDSSDRDRKHKSERDRGNGRERSRDRDGRRRRSRSRGR